MLQAEGRGYFVKTLFVTDKDHKSHNIYRRKRQQYNNHNGEGPFKHAQPHIHHGGTRTGRTERTRRRKQWRPKMVMRGGTWSHQQLLDSLCLNLKLIASKKTPIARTFPLHTHTMCVNIYQIHCSPLPGHFYVQKKCVTKSKTRRRMSNT